MSSILSSSTSTGLLARVRARDAEAWKRLARLYTPLVYRWARQGGLQASDAADVVQEVFLAVTSNIDGFSSNKPGSSFRAWLRTITRNHISLNYRKRRTATPGTGGTDAARAMQQQPDLLESDDEPPADDSVDRLVHRALELIRHDFQPRTWQAFWRVTVADESVAVVAEDLGLTPAAVRQAKYRVLCRLHDEIGAV